ncbi:MAG: ATP-dependent DNA helicase [Desulforhopalus sp.]
MEHLRNIFGRGGVLSTNVGNFEPRDGQIAMAEAIENVLSDPEEECESAEGSARILVVEAETGIGKTLAYLIPAALSAKKVVISTATLNLQDQIINKDIPLIKKVLKLDFPVLCVKGRENYLCLYRWYQYRSTPQLTAINDQSLGNIEAWLQITGTGDRAELDWLGEQSPLWRKICSTATKCFGGECPEAAGCFINRLRKDAGKARMLIVNHHLLFSDLVLRNGGFGELLPRYQAVIFDEAHHLENIASTFFGKRFSQYQLLDLLNDVEHQAKFDLPPETADAVLSALGGLRKRAENFSQLFAVEAGRQHLQPLIDNLAEGGWHEEVDLLSTGIARFADQLNQCASQGEGWNVLAKRCVDLGDNLHEIALGSGGEDDKFVRWYEKRERTVVISATPIEVAGDLQTSLYKRVESCVLTSATLSSGGSFRYLQDRLGLDDTAEYLQFSSPFDYANRTLLYVPERDFPEPSSREFPGRNAARIQEILHLSKGRALVLCTSFKGMDSLAACLDERLDYPVLVQGRGSRNSLLNRFRNETHSVLLAVASFWEGVDVVGESLSCVIIDKLPFEVPTDPVLMARSERIKDQGGKPFFEFQVPRAVLTLRQGVGRLMRAVNDRGVIVIMDVRLFTKGYGRIFLNSLPPSPVTRNLHDVEQFYQERTSGENS